MYTHTHTHTHTHMLLVLCTSLLCDGVHGVLEVDPSEVLIHSREHEERQEQHNSSSSPSEVVREALFSCLEVGYNEDVAHN